MKEKGIIKGIEITKKEKRVALSQEGVAIRRESRPISFEVKAGKQGKPIIAVTPPGYDNIGEILKKMGYEYEEVKDRELTNASLLSQFSVLFLNCSVACHEWAPKAGKILRKYVTDGGSVYGSDYAAAYLEEAFPDFFQAENTGDSGQYWVEISHRGLEQLLGKGIHLTFDLSSWYKVTRIQGEYQKYLVYGSTPLLVSFQYGRGQVIFTSFHNQAQPSDLEKKLLEYLVLKPLVAPISLNVSTLTETDKGRLQEIPISARTGQGEIYYYQQTRRGTLLFMVNWSGGPAEFKLLIWHPNGKLYQKSQAPKPPCIIRVPEAEIGTWKYQVIPITIPYSNFPYIVSAGPEVVMLKALPPTGEKTNRKGR